MRAKTSRAWSICVSETSPRRSPRPATGSPGGSGGLAGPSRGLAISTCPTTTWRVDLGRRPLGGAAAVDHDLVVEPEERERVLTALVTRRHDALEELRQGAAHGGVRGRVEGI